jgi:predicted ATP-binding protein involved in virulence
MIIPKLTEVFPNCQFIVSTHSPHILTHVQPENIFLLTQTSYNITVQKPNESYGKNVDRILEDLMELDTTRPNVVSEKLHDIFRMIDHNQLEDAQNVIVEMRAAIGNDPELLRAEILIKRKEIIGK